MWSLDVVWGEKGRFTSSWNQAFWSPDILCRMHGISLTPSLRPTPHSLRTHVCPRHKGELGGRESLAQALGSLVVSGSLHGQGVMLLMMMTVSITFTQSQSMF